MKRLLFFAFLSLVSIKAFSQDDAERALKNAGKAISSYYLDPAGNKDKLAEARTAIDIAVKSEANAANLKTWMTQGQIYNAIASNDNGQLMINKDYKLKELDAPYTAYTAYMKAFELAEKKYDKKDALKGMLETSNYLSNAGISKFETKDFKGAYNSISSILKIRELVKANGMDDVFSKEEDANNTEYIAGLSALNAGMLPEAKTHFDALIKKNYDKPEIVEGMYRILMQSNNKDEALKVLEAGRAKYPDEVNLLFTEINHYLTDGKLDILVDKLKLAIQKEPNNVPLYITLGNVYDNLFQRETDYNSPKANEYFNSALEYYNQAKGKDPNNFDAHYSVGALYYNKAAAITKELNKLADDYSKDGIKKYDVKKAEMISFFDQALPFFQSAEMLNPNDNNTLIALKEIYAKKDQLDLSNEFKKRLDNIGAGQSNKSYFKK